MNAFSKIDMGEVTRLTQAGKLAEAMALLQGHTASSLLCSRSRGKARLSARSARPPSAKKGHSCAELGAERETTVDQTLIRGLVTAFRVFVSGLSSV